MPLRQYFVRVGSILLVGLFAANWCLSVSDVHAPRSEIFPNERINLRIRSDHKWLEEVVFDTTRSRLRPAADASPEDDLPSQDLAQAEQRGPLEAFAAMVPASATIDSNK